MFPKGLSTSTQRFPSAAVSQILICDFFYTIFFPGGYLEEGSVGLGLGTPGIGVEGWD